MEQNIDINEIRLLVTSVKTKYNFDFGEYAISSFKRRLLRVLEVYKLSNMQSLTDKIVSDKVFYEKFLKEITVNTTEMFRDPSLWKMLKEKVFPELSQLSSIRIWHSACSTGEEVFSMCIALKECGLLEKSRLVASDINEDVIKVAQSGKYPLRNMALNSENYLNGDGKKNLTDYYKVVGDQACMNLDLTSNVLYRKFDLVMGEPFSKFDLILCRNVLIYFNVGLQDRVIGMFLKSMMPNAFLSIGSKESIAFCKSVALFDQFSFEEKIYRKK